MQIEKWFDYFKPETRSSGDAVIAKGIVSVSRGSDTELTCYIRSSTPFKVVLKTPSIDSPSISVSCSCLSFKKGSFCKHIWAALMCVETQNPDFLEEKTLLSKTTDNMNSATQKAPTESELMYQVKQAEYKTIQKHKQSLYRKEQYQKQKDKIKLKKQSLSHKKSTPTLFPKDVESAIHYFSENGFELRESLSAESVGEARKKLARVFHPDRGGSHEEITELNRQTEILTKFCSSL